MGDNFIVCIDRIIASSTSCFGPVGDETVEADERECDRVLHVEPDSVSDKGGGQGCSSSSSLSNKDDVVVVVECRICQEEDQFHAMEAPCSCNGTLKFAHRKCIQRWCNKKGNIICEIICNQAFSPNYSIPPARSNDIMAIDIRQEWEHNADLHVALEHHILLVCQALTVRMNSATGKDSSIIFNVCSTFSQLPLLAHPQFQMSFLRFAGILLPCCVMACSWYVIQNRRRRQICP